MHKQISIVAFTKNRPLQLHGYLASVERFLPADAIQTYVLYKPELFESEYEACFRAFPDCRVIRETNFFRDFLQLLERIETPYILFGIDDLAYFNGVSLDTIEKIFAQMGDQVFGFSLRLDKNQMPHDVAVGNVKECSAGGPVVYAVDWTKGKDDNTRYPFELCATIYRTSDVRRLFRGVMSHNYFAVRFLQPGSKCVRFCGYFFKPRKLLKRLGFFYNPNTLESWCCRYVQQHPGEFGSYLAFQKNCASAIQVNMVNTSTANEWDNSKELTVEVLAEKYRQGWRLDIDWLCQNRPQTTHADAQYFRLKNGVSKDVKIL